MAQIAAGAPPPDSPSPKPPQVARPAADSAPSNRAAGGLASMAGLRVHDIQFRSPSILDPDRLRALIQQKAQEPLDKIKLRRSIQTLYATGRFSDIQVEAERTPDNELSLVFVAKENYFVGRMTLYGAPRHGPSDHQLINASKFQLGEIYSDDKLQRSLESMKRLLADNGYHQATIDPQFDRHPETQQIDINFWVTPGAQARVGVVTVTGSSGLTAQELSRIAKLRPGDPVGLNRVNRALQRLRKRFQKQDRLEAQVTVTNRSYDPARNAVDYEFNIVRGPKVDIRVEGAKLNRGVLKKNIPVYEENAVDSDLLNEGRRNLRDYLQTEGFFDASVDYVQHPVPEADELKVVYDVDRGKRHKLVSIVLQGNHYFNTEILRDHMAIQTAGRLFSHGVFSSEMLVRDVQSLEGMYRANGFQQVAIRSEVDDNYQGVEGRMQVVLHIDEGPQTLVSAVKIAGVQSFPETEIRERLSTLEGQPYSDANVISDRDALQTFYFNRGFPNVSVESSATPVSAIPPRMAVTYTVQEGQRFFVDHVLVNGLNYTRPYVVQREILVHPNNPLSQADLLDTQRQLYDLGIFNQVDTAIQNPAGEETYKNVLVNVYEAPRYTIDYGLGLEVQTGTPAGVQNPQGRTGVSPRVSFDITRTNFLGKDHTIYFKSHVGRLQQRALLTYEAPRWLDHRNLKLRLTAYYDNTQDVTTFTSSRLEGSVGAVQKWGKATTLEYRFSYRLVKVDPRTLVIDPNLIPLLSRPERIGIPSFTYVRDTRDDPTDSHKGHFISVDTGLSAKAFGSEASFWRFLAEHSTYKSFNRNKYVVAFSTRIGFMPPFGAPGAIVPLPERFFSGGPTSLRGFSINQAGPRDQETGFPLGGEALFINNIELRLPPVDLPFFGRSLSPVVFHDMGNVFASTSDLFPSLFRVTQRDRQSCQLVSLAATCDFNYLSHAVGAGLRYKTPIGPVSLDFGYNLNPPTFPIRSQSRSETLRRLNFFFNIGQTF